MSAYSSTVPDRVVERSAEAGYAAVLVLLREGARLPMPAETWAELRGEERAAWEGAARLALDGGDSEAVHEHLRGCGALPAEGDGDPTPTQRAAYELFRSVVEAVHVALCNTVPGLEAP